MSHRQGGEFERIGRMTRGIRTFSKRLRTGVGDDCAVIAAEGDDDLLVTSDLLVEKVHFDRLSYRPEEIGQKALRVSLSDIAAMGGRPDFALVSMAIPDSVAPAQAEAVYRGIREAAEEFRVTLVGGDLSRIDGALVLDVVLVGTVVKGTGVLRSGARAGDRLFVSGTLGDAALGLEVLKAGLQGSAADLLARRQRRPEPRLALGALLAANGLASAMIDVSDGLSSDLGHLCRSSGVGARVSYEKLPRSESFGQVASQDSMDPAFAVLHGGEDYELLFAVPSEHRRALDRYPLPVPVTEIGEVLTASEGISVQFADGSTTALRPGGYDHFRDAT